MSDTVLVEPLGEMVKALGVTLDDGLVKLSLSGTAQMVMSNSFGFIMKLDEGAEVGSAVSVDVESITAAVTGGENGSIGRCMKGNDVFIREVMLADEVAHRQHQLDEFVRDDVQLPNEDRQLLGDLLKQHHDVFCLSDWERGETNLVEMEIHTGDATPLKQAARRMPFGVRKEVAAQLRNMQTAGVIESSSSPWASPIVLVRKKDGTLRFCIDYRGLNSVTKLDTFPLPRIDDLLDQLGKSKYFSTLDLASSYWQIRVHRDSKEKTAFITCQGLYQFKVMPFGLTNASSVFRRLMQHVLMGLNPDNGSDIVGVYIDDVIVFSETPEKHLQHLNLVLKRLKEANLKLKLSKCRFIRHEVKYLGHVITPQGLRVHPDQVRAVACFPEPKTVAQIRQFLGLA